MPEKSASVRKLSDKNTKQEMLDAYNAMAKQLEEKRASELNVEKRAEAKRTEEAVKVAEAVAPDSVDRDIGALKSEIAKMLAGVSEKLVAEAGKFRNLRQAVESKERELQELYGIERAAATLAALIEAQHQKKADFDAEMAKEREELEAEIAAARAEWAKEAKAREAEIKERDAAEKKARDREKEQFDYAFKRDQQALRDKLADEKAGLEKEIKAKREAAEKDWAAREAEIAGRESELAQLREKVAAFPGQLEAAVGKAVKDGVEKVQAEGKGREDLIQKAFEGERNVLLTKIESLEKTAKDLAAINGKLSAQLENAYQKVQEIAEKTVEGAAQSKSLADLQKLVFEQPRKAGAEK